VARHDERRTDGLDAAMNSGACRTIGFLLLLLAPLLAPMPAGAAPATSDSLIEFRYAPPHGHREIVTVETTTEKDLGALGRIVDRRTTRTSLEYRRVASGYTVTARTLSADMTRDGKPRADPILDVMRRLELVYNVGLDGGLRRIDGLAGLMDTLARSQPPEVAKALAPLLSPDAVFAREAAEWNGRYQDFADAALHTGDRIEAPVPFSLPNGDTLTYHMVISIAGREPCGAARCARIEIAYDSNLDAVHGMIDQVTGRIIRAAGADSLGLSSSGGRVTGTVSRLVDPATLLIRSEVTKRVMRMTVRAAGQEPVPVVMTETRTYTYRAP
jgi:hypothetical protein